MAAKKPNEIHISRIYNAPVKAVWDAWTDPKQTAQWWGPRGFTLTTHAKDLKPGGIWHYTMHGPDGTDWPNKTLYHEVEKYSRLVYDHGGNDEQAPLFRVTVTFEEVKGKTKMEMTMALATAAAAQETKKFIKKAGGNGTWDRLAEYLEKESTGKEKFFINRTFEAPLEKIWEVWTNPKHIANWLPPTGFKMEYLSADIRPGGSSHYLMYNDHGMKMYGKANYLEITKPSRLVYTQVFCDETGTKVTRHPAAPTWPETRVTVEWEVIGKATAEEMQTFIQGRAGMSGGWGGSFDKLDAYLAGQK
jgi:uncharacterized protein YndB with AHSA1/START domain